VIIIIANFRYFPKTSYSLQAFSVGCSPHLHCCFHLIELFTPKQEVMKKVLFLIIMLFLLVACEKEQVAPTESDSNSLATVDLRGASEAITMVNDLIAQVEEMRNQGNIGHGPGQSILSKLRNIKSKLERGQISVALSQLNALLIHLEGLSDEGTLSASIAEGLIFDVETIACEADPDCDPLDILKLTINTGTETYTLYIHPENQRISGVNAVPWGGYQTDTELPNYATAGAAMTDFNGYENTEVIVATLDALGENNYAAKVCADLEGGGYSDWYLPALGELMPMLTHFGKYGENNFNTSLYWSSTEVSASGAWRPSYYISYGQRVWFPIVAGKYFNSGSCRCVRKWNR
jgi:hypothetical protein